MAQMGTVFGRHHLLVLPAIGPEGVAHVIVARKAQGEQVGSLALAQAFGRNCCFRSLDREIQARRRAQLRLRTVRNFVGKSIANGLPRGARSLDVGDRERSLGLFRKLPQKRLASALPELPVKLFHP